MAFRTPRFSNATLADTSSQDEALDSSVDMHSPSSPNQMCIIQPRKLQFALDDDMDRCKSPKKATHHTPKQPAAAASPPYRKVRALRLFDTPATPKTILQKSSSTNHLSGATQAEFSTTRPRSLPLHNRALENVMNQQTANVNPFTPDSMMAHNKKRCRTQFVRENLSNKSLQQFLTTEDENNGNASADGDYQAEMQQAPKRLALQDTNISRYQKEFIEISLIGIGEFGLVYQCLNRLDGCIYAIKKSIKPVAGSSFEKRALNEVWAHAVLGKHDNVVRYYSAWAEDNHMLIQNEFCNGGSLQSLIQKRCLTESELKVLLVHVAEGLRYIHSNDLVHMDLKSGNIFITKVPSLHKTALPPLTKECYESGMEGIYEELSNSECIITYKIGDLGHVTSVKHANVEEGDCRYLPNEILHEDFSQLYKADIFALGITLYEAAGGGPLPKNGPEWHKLRDGNVPDIPTLSREFNDLIKIMTHPDPEKRPTSTSIFNHPILSSLESKSKTQLNQELLIEKRKNEILLRKLREAKKQLKSFEQSAKGGLLRSPQIRTPQRCLRSYTRMKRGSTGQKNNNNNTKLVEGLRDRNKNVINNLQY